MKAAVFHKPKDLRVDEVPEPRIEHPRDALVRVAAASICGSDLHVYNGLLPLIRPTILGHEFVGVVEEVGPEVEGLRPGDRVVAPFAVAEGACWFCRHGLPMHCERTNPNYGPEGEDLKQKGGGVIGGTDLYGGYEGGQAERVRVPFADAGPRRLPPEITDEEGLLLADVLPAGYAAVEWAGVGPGDAVAVFGCGAVGLMALACARLRGAEPLIAVDRVAYRLALAARLTGARTLDASRRDPVDAVRDLTAGRGADACIDAVGMAADQRLSERLATGLHWERGTTKVLGQCLSAVRRGGRIAVVGVYAGVYDNFPMGKLFEKGLALRAGQASVHGTIDALIALLREKRLDVRGVITHVLPLREAPRAYELLDAKEDGCVKVALRP